MVGGVCARARLQKWGGGGGGGEGIDVQAENR